MASYGMPFYDGRPGSAQGMLTGGRPMSARPFQNSLQGLFYTSALPTTGSKNDRHGAWDDYVKKQHARNVESLMRFTLKNADNVASDAASRWAAMGPSRLCRPAHSARPGSRASSPRRQASRSRRSRSSTAASTCRRRPRRATARRARPCAQ